MKPVVKDNFLPSNEYEILKKEILGDYFPWYFHDTVATNNDKEPLDFFWTHIFFKCSYDIFYGLTFFSSSWCEVK